MKGVLFLKTALVLSYELTQMVISSHDLQKQGYFDGCINKGFPHNKLFPGYTPIAFGLFFHYFYKALIICEK